MRRETLERHQVWLYLAAILAGLAVGRAAPAAAPALEALLWPGLAALLYATFTQVPMARLPAAFRDTRLMSAIVLGNFVVLPVVAWGLLALVPDDPAVRLGVLLVLLVPCTDWFIAFTHQAGGDTGAAVAATPALLLAQMALLPAYLWLFTGDGLAGIASAGRMAAVFAVVIAAPLALAWLTERGVTAARPRAALAWLPVPLLALVLLLVAASQVEAVLDALPLLGEVMGAFAAFLVAAVALGIVLGRLFGLPVRQARTLLFSFATRNSFVVLPLALALPAGWEATAIVIVFQSLVELFGVLVLLRLVPDRLLPDPARAGTP